MAKFCSKGCEEAGAICDFCINYNFNGDKNGVYLGKGYCKLTGEPQEPQHGHGCKEFICMRVEQREDI